MFREKRYTSGVPSLPSVSDCLESVWFITAQRSLIFLDAARPRSLNHFPTFFPSRASFFARTPHSNRRKLLKPLLKLTDRFLEPGSIAPIFFHLCHDNEFIFFVFSTSSTWHFHSSTPFFLPLGIFLAPTSRLTQFSSHEWISASRLSAHSLQQTTPLVVANIITRSEQLIEDRKKKRSITAI